MKLKKFALSLLLATFPLTSSVSAEVLNVNLEECINLALQNNRNIEQSLIESFKIKKQAAC